MDGNSYQSYSNPADFQYTPGLSNSANESMPPVAPSYKHAPAEGNDYSVYYSDQQTLIRLMDSVHEGRMENIQVGQKTMAIRLADVQIVQGGIEVHGQIIPKHGIYEQIMPPLAPSYKHWSSPLDRNNYPLYNSDQQTVNRLMDSVHQGRVEDIRVEQKTIGIRLEDVQIVQGAIEVRAKIITNPAAYSENSHYSGYLNPTANYTPSVNSYPYQYSNQFGDRSTYPPPYPPSYQSPYQPPYQPLCPAQYPYPNQVIFPQYLPQFIYRNSYPNQFPAQYPYQYPMVNVAGSIANAIGQLARTTNLLRR